MIKNSLKRTLVAEISRIKSAQKMQSSFVFAIFPCYRSDYRSDPRDEISCR